jgi:hypothetical protein
VSVTVEVYQAHLLQSLNLHILQVDLKGVEYTLWGVAAPEDRLLEAILMIGRNIRSARDIFD